MTNVLVADRDRFVRRSLKESLIKFGYDVLDAANGKAALDIAFQNKIDLILLDLDIPGMSCWEVLEKLKEESRTQSSMDFESHSNTQTRFKVHTITEIEESEDTYETEIGIRKFLEFLITDCPHKEQDMADGGNGKKMEFRVYPSENIHAKVYICRLTEEQLDYGKVITGSSNFSESGLIANREFNVELKNKADVDFALNQFEDLWSNSVDISQDYVDTVQKDTWLREDISDLPPLVGTVVMLHIRCLDSTKYLIFC